MAQTLTDRKDVQFVLFDQLNIEELTKGKRFADLNKKTFDMVISEARSLATKEMLPTSADADQEGCLFEGGDVKVPESFHRVYDQIKKGEWIAVADDLEVGGQGMPEVISLAVLEMFHASNSALAGFPMLGHGAAKLVEIFGTEQMKELFLQKMYSGQWGGTMLLTEPNAGSDVGALETTATKNSDGTYSVQGNKIFISGGEHDLTENIIHPVLARIEGAPEGTAGISLFIVPKVWVNDDGSMGEANDVICTGIEEKIGLHGSPTCSLTLGGKGNCKGFLLGEANKGIKVMFHMMNEARLAVAVQALGLASSAYLYSVNYAKERLQGKSLTGAKGGPQVPIIQHPDIRRMLLWMKAQVEGNRSMNFYTAFCMDKVAITEDEEEKEYLEDLIGFLTPICKAYTSEKSCQVCGQAIQVHGGYGACRDYPVEQLLRDCKITTIYEGTTGIQAMDLLGRKIGMKQGKPFKSLIKEIGKVTAAARKIPDLKDLAGRLDETITSLSMTTMQLAQAAATPKVLEAFAQACPLLEVFGDVILAWMLLWRASAASTKLDKILGDADDEKKKTKINKNKDAAYYHGQIQTARYFINSVLPGTIGKMNAISNIEAAPVKITNAGFGG